MVVTFPKESTERIQIVLQEIKCWARNYFIATPLQSIQEEQIAHLVKKRHPLQSRGCVQSWLRKHGLPG